MNDGTPILEARHLVRRVTVDGVVRSIVDDFSFAFLPGRIYSLMGPSGAGKSSVLRLFNRLDEPDAGDIWFEGEDYRSLAPCALRRRVGYLFQTPYLFPGTVSDNILFADNTLADSDIIRLLEAVSFSPERRHQPAGTLSVGEKQRVAMARLLATGPSVILLDEPTAALDPTYTVKIESSVRRIADEKHLTVIMVSHSPDQALRMGGDGLLLAAGRLEEFGPVAKLVNDPQTSVGRRYRDKELT